MPFVEESREEITRSNINQSTSKNLWSFSKEKRFSEKKPNCPYVCYETGVSTISNRKTQFGNSQRKVFTEISDAPCSWNYNPLKKDTRPSSTFGEARDVLFHLFRNALLIRICRLNSLK
jgi:hypothetical protein